MPITLVEFIASRARVYLERLTAFGPRPTGSKENEIMAVNYIIGALEDIKSIHDTNNYSSIRYFQKSADIYILNINEVDLICESITMIGSLKP